MVVGGSLSRKQALKRVTAKQYDLAQQPVIDPRFTGDTDFFGIPACSGIVTGKVVKSDEKTLANSRIKLAPRMGKGLATEIVQALSEQAVVVPGTQATTIVMARLAQQLASLRKQRDEIAAEVERLSACSPSLAGPGLHARSRAQDCSTTPDRSGPQAFASAAHLAAYAGLAPVTRRSRSSIRGEHPSRRGNKVLKRALFLSAFTALRDPISGAYYSRKIQQGKCHKQALIALARRRCDILFAMLRDDTFYQPKAAPSA